MEEILILLYRILRIIVSNILYFLRRSIELFLELIMYLSERVVNFLRKTGHEYIKYLKKKKKGYLIATFILLFLFMLLAFRHELSLCQCFVRALLILSFISMFFSKFRKYAHFYLSILTIFWLIVSASQ